MWTGATIIGKINHSVGCSHLLHRERIQALFDLPRPHHDPHPNTGFSLRAANHAACSVVKFILGQITCKWADDSRQTGAVAIFSSKSHGLADLARGFFPGEKKKKKLTRTGYR